VRAVPLAAFGGDRLRVGATARDHRVGDGGAGGDGDALRVHGLRRCHPRVRFPDAA
jgi:hypothetical protein